MMIKEETLERKAKKNNFFETFFVVFRIIIVKIKHETIKNNKTSN